MILNNDEEIESDNKDKFTAFYYLKKCVDENRAVFYDQSTDKEMYDPEMIKDNPKINEMREYLKDMFKDPVEGGIRAQKAYVIKAGTQVAQPTALVKVKGKWEVS